jgi:DNA-binding transcriptional ArsR family regulator
VVREPTQVRALNHPTRVAILEALRVPAAAASVARAISQPRQLVNYHMRVLTEARLIERVEERRKGNFIEGVYRAVARSFVVAADASWTPRQAEVMREQYALGALLDLGGRIQRDATTLLNRAAEEDITIPSAAGVADLHFPNDIARITFLNAYRMYLKELSERYSSKGGQAYRVVMAIYPTVGTNPADEERERQAAEREAERVAAEAAEATEAVEAAGPEMP